MLYRFKQWKKLRARGCLTRLLQILPWSHGVGKVPTQIIHGIGQTERKIEVKLSPFSSNWFNLRLLYFKEFSWILIGHDVKVFEMIQTQVRVDYFLWSVTSQSFSQEESCNDELTDFLRMKFSNRFTRKVMQKNCSII